VPRVSVLTPVFNGSDYIIETIRSVQNQTMQDFEHVIIDDGSTDNTWQILQSQTDPRLKIKRHESNQGLLATRNYAASLASGEFLAILDHDDLWMPKKLEKQLAFFEANEDASIVATKVKTMDTNSIDIGYMRHLFVSPEDLKVALLFRNYLGHSSMMIRSKKVNAPMYAEEFPLCEDYFLSGMLSNISSIHIIEEFLVRYRIHQSISRRKHQAMRDYSMKVKDRLLQLHGIKATASQLNTHQAFDDPQIDQNLFEKEIEKLGAWLQSLHIFLLNNKSFDSKSVDRVLSKTWFEFCLCHWRYGPIAWNAYCKFFTPKNKHIALYNLAEFFMKSKAIHHFIRSC
jgi:glycosyltransferase involved in cell wall biosynthesis